MIDPTQNLRWFQELSILCKNYIFLKSQSMYSVRQIFLLTLAL